MNKPAGLLWCAVLAFCMYSCNNDKQKAKDEKAYAAGDRNGADTAALKNIKGSTDIAELICQRWENKDDYEVVRTSGNREKGELEMPMRGFYFFKDGLLVKNARDKMEFGTWVYDDAARMIKINFKTSPTENYKIDTASYNSLLLKKQGADEKAVEYIADGFVDRNIKEDPFYPSNMQWRIKAATAESDAALHKRLKDCLYFYYLYYMDNYKRNSPEISFYGLPGCFTWYAGGIHLKSEDKLEKNWMDIFYNKQNAADAYKIMDKMISKKYVWDKEEKNWVKQNAGVLKQMAAKIDSL